MKLPRDSRSTAVDVESSVDLMGVLSLLWNFIIVKNACAGKRTGRHLNIKHQNQTAFINLLNIRDQKFVSVITIS